MLGNDRDYIHRLPDGILVEHVFPRIKGEVCSFVCRRWRELELSRRRLEIVWRPSGGLVKHHSVKQGPRAYIPRLGEHYPGLLHLRWCEQETGRFGFLDLEGVSWISQSFPILRTLSLVDCISVTDDAVAQLAVNCKDLRALRLENCPHVGEAGLDAVVGQVQLAGGAIDRRDPPGAAAAEGPADVARTNTSRLCSMRVLQVLRCPKFSHKCLQNLLMVWGPGLRVLQVAQCGAPSDAWLNTVGSLCFNLETLWLGKFAGAGEGEDPMRQDLGLHQQLLQLWAQFQVQAQAAAGQGQGQGQGQALNNRPAPLPPLPLPPPPPPLAFLWQPPFRAHGHLMTNAGIESLAESCTGSKLKRLMLHPCKEVTAGGLAMLAQHCSNLEVLDLGRGLWEREGMARSLQLLRASCPALHTLALSGRKRGGLASLSAAELLPVMSGLPSLSSLSLGAFLLQGSSQEWGLACMSCAPNLTALRLWELDAVDNNLLTAVGLNCQRLKELWVECQPQEGLLGLLADQRRAAQVTEEALCSLITGCRKVEKLRLAGLEGIADVTLARLVHSCGCSLRVVDLDNCAVVGGATLQALSAGCPRLERLRLGRRVDTSDESLAAIVQGCSKLTGLALWDCPRVTDRGLVEAFQQRHGAPRLQKLILRACLGISEDGVTGLLSLGCQAPELLELNKQSVVLDVRIYLAAARAGCTISNLSCGPKGSLAGDMEDPDWRTEDLDAVWSAATQMGLKEEQGDLEWPCGIHDVL